MTTFLEQDGQDKQDKQDNLLSKLPQGSTAKQMPLILNILDILSILLPNAMRTTEMRTTEKQKTATENRQASLICTVGALCKRANVDINNVH